MGGCFVLRSGRPGEPVALTAEERERLRRLVSDAQTQRYREAKLAARYGTQLAEKRLNDQGKQDHFIRCERCSWQGGPFGSRKAAAASYGRHIFAAHV